MLRVEQLEGRDVPATFGYDYTPDDFYIANNYQGVRTFEYAAAEIGARIVSGQHIHISLRTEYLPSDRVAEARGNTIVIDPRHAWHVSPTKYGLTWNETDLYSVLQHEIGHVLGIGVVPGWGLGALARGVPLAGDGFHVANGTSSAMNTPSAGVRDGFTDIDYAILGDLGYPIGGPPAYIEYGLLSTRNGSGLTDQYIVYGAGVYYIGTGGPQHIIYDDFDLNGSHGDQQVVSTSPGVEYIISASGGYVQEPAYTLGANWIFHRYHGKGETRG